MFKMNNVQLRNPGGGSAVAAPAQSSRYTARRMEGYVQTGYSYPR